MHLRHIGPFEATSLVGIVVGFGFLGIAGRWALLRALTEPPKVLPGMRLAVGTLIGSALGTVLSGFVYYSGTSCAAGPPSIQIPALCTLVKVSGLLFLTTALMFLVSLVVWPPWRRPLRLQLVRAALGVSWWLAYLLAFLGTGFIFDT